MGVRAYVPKEKTAEIVPLLEDVLALSCPGPGWKRLFEKLGGFFSAIFGKEWEKSEKAFWEEVSSGKYDQKPVVLKK